MLVFWEVTRACLLACAHCRASATPDALPGELGTEEGRRLIDQVAGFGRPYPILVLTGGDCLLRKDTFELVEYANSLGVPVATLGNWSRRGTASAGASGAVAPPSEAPTRRPVSELEAENSRLRRELADAKLDVEVLRKATAYFARGSR